MDELKKIWQLFITFLKIGTFTFGGGLAMIPLIQKEVSEKKKWIEEEEMLDIFAIAQSTPGVISISVSVFVGKKVAGIKGMFAAALGLVIPAFVSIILVLVLLSGFRDNKHVSNVLSGIKAASAALILLSAIKLGKSSIRGKMGYIIAASAFLLIVVLNMNAAWAVLFGGLAGYLSYFINRRKRKC